MTEMLMNNFPCCIINHCHFCRLKALEEQLKKQEDLILQQTSRWDNEIHSMPSAELENLMNKLSDESPSQPENSSPDVCMHVY